MKKFQKFLSAGLILAQVCSSSLALNDDSTACSSSLALNDDSTACSTSLALDNIPRDNQVVLVKTQRAPKKFSIATTFFKLAGLALGAEATLQLLCANHPGLKLALAGYADTETFKFSDYVKPHASLRDICAPLETGAPLPNDVFDNILICEEITGGWQQAAKIAALGFAKDIYVKYEDDTGFKFCYMPGDYGLTAVDACNYLQYLIQKANDLPECADSAFMSGTDTLAALVNRLDLLQSCVSYKVWHQT